MIVEGCLEYGERQLLEITIELCPHNGDMALDKARDSETWFLFSKLDMTRFGDTVHESKVRRSGMMLAECLFSKPWFGFIVYLMIQKM